MECYSRVNNAGGAKATRSDRKLCLPIGFIVQLIFRTRCSRTFSGKLSQKILTRCMGSQQSSRIFKLGRAKHHDDAGSLRFVDCYFTLRNRNMGLDYNV
jgi:hypothetical protein